MDLSLAEYATARGISRQRALAMVNAGQIDARRVGRVWVVDQRELANRRSVSRPLSRRMVHALVQALSGVAGAEFTSEDRFHVVRYIKRLQTSGEPSVLLHSWMRSRQLRVVNVAANPADLVHLASDERVVPSGISDERAGLSAASEFEGYVAESEVDSILRQNLLVGSDAPNVRLHVVHDLPTRPIPLGLVLADLADWNRPREDGRVLELIAGVRWNR